MRRVIGIVLLAVAAAALAVGLLPRPAIDAAPGPAIAGFFHVHTELSHDGRGTLAQVAAAARELGGSFVVITDHERRHQDLPRRIDGVLLVSGVELSAQPGHVIALGLGALPEERGPAVLQAIRDAGGEAVLAHPVNRRRPWADPSPEGFLGFEALSLDSALRASGAYRKILAGLALAGDPIKAGALLMGRPVEALRRYDELTGIRPVTLFCGVDAHGVPPHAVSFGALAQYVDLGAARARFGRSDRADAAALLGALREGRTHCGVPAIGDASSFRFSAAAGEIAASVDAPGTTIVLVHDGREVARGPSPVLRVPASPGAWRAEVLAPAPLHEHPWIVSSARRVSP